MASTRRLRRLWMAASTVLGLKPQGFFIPYRHAASIPAERPPYRAIEGLFEAHRDTFGNVLAEIDGYADALLAIGAAPPPAPRWRQGWFPRLDAAAAYALIRTRRPAHIVEVGSGHSTRFLARAAADGGFRPQIVAIDPQPRADIAALPVRLIQSTVQEAGLQPFAALGPGDVLFIDSSHIAQPGSDVDLLLNRVVPTLAEGILVHIHDVLLPDDYPAAWAWRGYNEQLLAAALLGGNGFAPLFASHYVATRMADAVAAGVAGRLDNPFNAPETSLWLLKTAAPIGPL